MICKRLSRRECSPRAIVGAVADVSSTVQAVSRWHKFRIPPRRVRQTALQFARRQHRSAKVAVVAFLVTVDDLAGAMRRKNETP
jgi:hypothetical protein